MASFRDGYKVNDDGRRVDLERAKTNLSSDGITPYSTRLWKDGTASCDCPGWTRRVSDRGERACRHTRELRPTKDWIEASKAKRCVFTGCGEEAKLAGFCMKHARDPLPRRMSGLDELRRLAERKRAEAEAAAKPAPKIVIVTPVNRAAIRFDGEV